MEQVDGQLDVFEVLELIEKEGVMGKPKRKPHARGELKWEIERLTPYKYHVTIEYLGETEIISFYSQIECWAFIKGYEAALARLRG